MGMAFYSWDQGSYPTNAITFFEASPQVFSYSQLSYSVLPFFALRGFQFMFVTWFRHLLISVSLPMRRPARQRSRPLAMRPQLEALEQRLAPAITLKFLNQNPAYNYDNIYVQFWDDPNFDATVNGTKLLANTNYSLTFLNNSGDGTILNQMVHGRIFISVGKPLATSD